MTKHDIRNTPYAIREMGIIMSGESVRAILEGRKTQTRRVIKPQPFYYPGDQKLELSPFWTWTKGKIGYDSIHSDWPNCLIKHCPYGQIGDRLWVKETFVIEDTRSYAYNITIPTDRPLKFEQDWEDQDYKYPLIPHYRSTEPEPHIVPLETGDLADDRTRWSSPFFMPKWAARLWLQIVDVRVERLQEIGIDDLGAEGYPPGWSVDEECSQAYEWFSDLWDSLNAKRGFPWEKDPWVWVIEFRVIRG